MSKEKCPNEMEEDILKNKCMAQQLKSPNLQLGS